MDSDKPAEVTALANNVTIPEALRWTGTRRGETFTLTTVNVRLLADGHLAARAYGRPSPCQPSRCTAAIAWGSPDARRRRSTATSRSSLV
jgi:hypothetical protein